MTAVAKKQFAELLPQDKAGVEHYREVVVLCDLEQRSYADAAVRLECPVGTVRSRLNRARGMLLAKLGTSHGLDDGAGEDASDIATGSPAGRWRRLGAGGRI